MKKSFLAVFLLLILVFANGCQEKNRVAIDNNKNISPGDSVAQTPPSPEPVEPAKPEPLPEKKTEPVTKPDTMAQKNDLSTKSHNWYFVPNKNHQIPGANNEMMSIMEKNKAFYVLPNEQKQIYLTFDEGYEMGYTSSILDTLKTNNVKAAFFITGHYIKTQPDLVKRMQAEGHLVCNHTWNHPDLSQSSPEVLKEEILSLERAYENLTGAKMASYLRPPMGKYSEKSLNLTNQLGYSTVFWSMAFKDWETDNQPGADYSYQHVINNIHPGAVILLHAVSESNTEALDRIITTLKEEGYVFATFPQ